MERNELLQMLDGRTVAIVGNGEPDRDYSQEIDAADVVIRFNHFYNYASGKVGKKVTAVMQIFTSAWNAAADKNAEAIKAQCPKIFCVRKPEQYQPTNVAHFLGSDVCVTNMSEFFRNNNEWTCGGTVLTRLASVPLNAKVRCYCFPRGDVAEKYFSGPAKHYKNWKQELVEQQRAIEILERSEIRRPRHEDECPIIIPIKESSEGASGKNDILLPFMLSKLADRPERIVLIGKADALADKMRERFPRVEYFRTGDPTGEVTTDLRMWRDFTEYCGEVINLLCTSPAFKPEWIDRLKDARKHAPIAAICEDVNFKINGIYAEAEGVFMQVVHQFGPPSTPRQRLPHAVHLTGGGFAFHSDALSLKSFYQAGVIRPVIVNQFDALDVDTPEDLAEAVRRFNI